MKFPSTQSSWQHPDPAKVIIAVIVVAACFWLVLPVSPLNEVATVHTQASSQDVTKYINISESKIQSIEIRGGQENTLYNTIPFPTCLDPDGPQPIILMSLGRSGSSSTWQVIGSLTGKKTTPSNELTGSNVAASRKFFKKAASFDRTHGGGAWLISYICSAQRKWPKAGVVGFKWKPYITIRMPAAIDALNVMARLDQPKIKVVRSRRNILDKLISREKHNIYNGENGEKVRSHCAKENEECIRKHLELGQNMVLDGKQILASLQNINKQEVAVDKMLDDYGIPHVDVTFEKLYQTENADEWNRILDFLDVGPRQNVTKEAVNEMMGHAPTSHSSHNITIKNYAEIVEALNGTGFEQLLHRK